ncbi:hypothetical protein K443DRAFT_5006 [Laccaria amethystina LaAM-08-1]|uniref:Uncharacterized protein n=1 Tax=Laccaria amethystina LaAM-08-1 TaxID=1095629 RepID=A0A0C9XGL6_9AGAR|nr:hypothetical protein K443DRAFT_5006 [Laccaria amethystina LaAM-08-1]
MYGILNLVKTAYAFKSTKENLVGTIDQLFHHFSSKGKLSDIGIKNQVISLELFIYKVEMEDSPVKLNHQYGSSYTLQLQSTKQKSSGGISSNDPYDAALKNWLHIL